MAEVVPTRYSNLLEAVKTCILGYTPVAEPAGLVSYITEAEALKTVMYTQHSILKSPVPNARFELPPTVK